MRIEIEVAEDTWRQPDAERKDNGDDLARTFTWLRLPEDVRRGLCQLMGTLSVNELQRRGLSREAALRVSDLYQTLM